LERQVLDREKGRFGGNASSHVTWYRSRRFSTLKAHGFLSFEGFSFGRLGGLSGVGGRRDAQIDLSALEALNLDRSFWRGDLPDGPSFWSSPGSPFYRSRGMLRNGPSFPFFSQFQARREEESSESLISEPFWLEE